MNYHAALIQLPLVRETATEHVAKPDVVYRICRDMGELAQETFQVLALTTKNRLINRHLISIGLVDTCLAAPREVFRPVILDGATNVIIVHAHPSGDPTPSTEDIRLTRQLVEAGKILGIPVLDHVIIGRPASPLDPGYLSMRESGLCNFT